MTAQPDHPPSGPELPAKDLRAIRAALVVQQDIEAFDASLKVVLDKVRITLDIAPYHEFLHRWWIMACDSAKDPDGRRQMWETAAKLQAGEPVPRGRDVHEILADRLNAGS